MASIASGKEYHCTHPCGGGECVFRFKHGEHLFATELEEPLVLFDVYRTHRRPAYGSVPEDKWWGIFAKNGTPHGENCIFHCTRVVDAKKSPGGYSGPLALQSEEEPF